METFYEMEYDEWDRRIEYDDDREFDMWNEDGRPL